MTQKAILFRQMFNYHEKLSAIFNAPKGVVYVMFDICKFLHLNSAFEIATECKLENKLLHTLLSRSRI